MGEPVRVAVVGCGVGQEHLYALRRLPERYEVLAVCDADPDRARQAAGSWKAPRALTDFEEVLALDGLELVDVCTPPHLHAEQVTAALEAGLHVLCEKPLAGSLAEVDALAEAAAASGKLLVPVLQYRFGHGLQKLRRLVDAGVTGTAFTATVEVAWRRRAEYYASPWRGRWATELGGVLLSQGIHAIDMLLYVLGPAASVTARTATRVNDIEVDDCAAVVVELADGSLATVSATLGSAAEISRHRFCFANLTAESGTSPYRNSAEPWTITPDSPEAAARVEEVLAAYDDDRPQGYAGQLHRLYDAIRGGESSPVTVADARAGLELVAAVYASVRQGGVPVPLPLDPSDPAYRRFAPDTVEELRP